MIWPIMASTSSKEAAITAWMTSTCMEGWTLVVGRKQPTSMSQAHAHPEPYVLSSVASPNRPKFFSGRRQSLPRRQGLPTPPWLLRR